MLMLNSYGTNLYIHQNGMHTYVWENGTVIQGWHPNGLNELLKEHNITWDEWAETAGSNTVMNIDDSILYYRHDVERFIAQIKDNTPTYFD